MKKPVFIFVIIILIFTVNSFGQNKKRKLYNLPEVDDEVLVAFRKKSAKHKTSTRKISQRKSAKRKAKPFFDEADALFGKRSKKAKVKSKKLRRK